MSQGDDRPVGSDTIHASIAHGIEYDAAVLRASAPKNRVSRPTPGVRTESHGSPSSRPAPTAADTTPRRLGLLTTKLINRLLYSNLHHHRKSVPLVATHLVRGGCPRTRIRPLGQARIRCRLLIVGRAPAPHAVVGGAGGLALDLVADRCGVGGAADRRGPRVGRRAHGAGQPAAGRRGGVAAVAARRAGSAALRRGAPAARTPSAKQPSMAST